jgi:hypothetical protein
MEIYVAENIVKILMKEKQLRTKIEKIGGQYKISILKKKKVIIT